MGFGGYFGGVLLNFFVRRVFLDSVGFVFRVHVPLTFTRW